MIWLYTLVRCQNARHRELTLEKGNSQFYFLFVILKTAQVKTQIVEKWSENSCHEQLNTLR